jgi:damage-control phosphatase, subfamily I
MRTYLDCIPCFFRQALDASRMAGADEQLQKGIMDELSRMLPSIHLGACPPEIGRAIYKMVGDISGVRDPFKNVKKKSNEMALSLYQKLARKIELSADRLLTAVELSIAGNVIDYGVKNSLNIEKEIEEIFSEDAERIKKENKTIFDYDEFKRALKSAGSILYLADNAGETVFDRILIEEILRQGAKKITYAVKEAAVINDALAEDAVACGIDKYAQIMSSGSDAPGTVLKYCSPEFLRLYENAEMIISKGQGNFEALSDENRPIFFMFKVKCPVIGNDINGNMGDIVLKANKGWGRSDQRKRKKNII